MEPWRLRARRAGARWCGCGCRFGPMTPRLSESPPSHAPGPFARLNPPAIRILLVDDHPTLRMGLANVLGCERDFAIVAEADDGPTALALWRRHRPDIVLLDVSLPGMDGIETLEKLRAEFPEARVLMLTSSEAADDVRHALSAGALGYVTKEIRRPELIAAIRAVSRGETAISDSIARELAAA